MTIDELKTLAERTLQNLVDYPKKGNHRAEDVLMLAGALAKVQYAVRLESR